MKRIPLHRLACLLAAVMLAALCVPAVSADEGDYDEIQSYVITVDPRQDGSADITYKIDWQVIGGGSGDYLSWVNIGLANSYADEIEILTPDTVADVSLTTDNGSYAKVTFHDKYYAPDVAAANGGQSRVEFAFRVHQSHLFTMNDDDTASFSFTPGWFEDICVQSLTVRWRNYDGFLADNQSVDGDYLVWEFGPLEHGERVNVNVTVPIVTADGYAEENERTSADTAFPVGEMVVEDSDSDGAFLGIFVLILVLVLVYSMTARPARWRGGMGADDAAAWIWYSNNLHTIRMRRGARPPAGYHTVPPPRDFHTGGGSTRGGGAGRSDTSHHSGCVCACACVSCACACACAGGGRAGCSVKNFYHIRLPQTAMPDKEQDHEH